MHFQVNPSDVDFVVGNAAGIDKVGVDFSGTVVAVGDGCSKFKIGDSIWGLTVSGAYADYTTAICAESALAPQTPSTVSVQDVFEGSLTNLVTLWVKNFSGSDAIDSKFTCSGLHVE